MSKVTNTVFLCRLRKIHNNQIIPLDNYSGSMKKIRFKCKVCNHIWLATPNDIINNHTGCPYCSHRYVGNLNRKGTAWFINKIKSYRNYRVIGPYISKTKPIKMEHITKHSHCFKIRPDSFLRGYHCPIVGRLNMKKANRHSTKWFLNKLKDLGFENYKILTPYLGMKHKIKIKHNICNHIFYTRPDHFICAGLGCPFCSKNTNSSYGERLVKKWLKKHNMQNHFIYGFKHFIHLSSGFYLHADFISRNYKIVIEYDGPQHFYSIPLWHGVKGLQERKRNDHIKNKYCKCHKIKLIRIEYPYKSNNMLKVKNVINKTLSKKLLNKGMALND